MPPNDAIMVDPPESPPQGSQPQVTVISTSTYNILVVALTPDDLEAISNGDNDHSDTSDAAGNPVYACGTPFEGQLPQTGQDYDPSTGGRFSHGSGSMPIPYPVDGNAGSFPSSDQSNGNGVPDQVPATSDQNTVNNQDHAQTATSAFPQRLGMHPSNQASRCVPRTHHNIRSICRHKARKAYYHGFGAGVGSAVGFMVIVRVIVCLIRRKCRKNQEQAVSGRCCPLTGNASKMVQTPHDEVTEKTTLISSV